MTHFLLALGLVALALASGVHGQTGSRGAAGSARTPEVYVSVLGANNAPVAGLTVADFVVREDGVTREVLKAEPAIETMQVVVLVDDSQAATDAVQPTREGLAAFVDKLQGRAEIGLVTMGDRATTLVPPTTDIGALKKGVNRIFARSGAGAYLLDAVMDVSRGFEQRQAVRPVIVALTMEGIEFSNLQYETVLRQLAASGASLHVVSVGTPGSSMADEMRNRNMVIAEGTARTGGRRDQVLTPSGIAEALPRVADELLNQYKVTYSRPETLIPPEKIQVTVSRPGLTVRARTRIPRR